PTKNVTIQTDRRRGLSGVEAGGVSITRAGVLIGVRSNRSVTGFANSILMGATGLGSAGFNSSSATATAGLACNCSRGRDARGAVTGGTVGGRTCGGGNGGSGGIRSGKN